MNNKEETVKMMGSSTYLPIYTGTTLQLMSIRERQRREKIKIIRNSIIIFVSILSVGIACFALYHFLFNGNTGGINTLPRTTESYSDIDKKLSGILANLSNIDERIEEIYDEPSEDPTTTITPKVQRNNFNSPSCGLTTTTPRIQYGSDAGINEFPWIVSLFVLNTSTGEVEPIYGCGGSLIRDDLVLTAAHCIAERKDVELRFIRLGEQNLDSDPDCEDGCTDKVQDIHIGNFSTLIHPDFNPATLANDVGLIHLKVKADLTRRNINTICLPFDAPKVPEKLKIIGFGSIQWPRISYKLQVGVVHLVPNDKCIDEYRRVNSTLNIDDSQFCALGKFYRVDKHGVNKTYDIDTCPGDSGSPVQFPNELGISVQWGITSGGYAKTCGSNTPPGFYVKVHSYLDWILENSEGNFGEKNKN